VLRIVIKPNQSLEQTGTTCGVYRKVLRASDSCIACCSAQTLAVFILGAGVSFIKHHLASGWTAKSIQTVKDGCLQQNETQEFCDCYASEISKRISKDKFLEMTKNMEKDGIFCSYIRSCITCVCTRIARTSRSVKRGVIILNVKNNEQGNSDCYSKFVHVYRVCRNNA
jgi:hypothetical protein